MRDDFSEATKATLARRVGMRCANPNCRRLTSGPHSNAAKSVNIGVAAHICAAATGGPRFDAAMTPTERSEIENGIWLCQNCAKLIDNDVTRYTVWILRAWKELSEEATRLAVETPQKNVSDIPILDDAISGRKIKAKRLVATLNEFINIYIAAIKSVTGIEQNQIPSRTALVNQRMKEIDTLINQTGVYDRMETILDETLDSLIITSSISDDVFPILQNIRANLLATRSGMYGYPAPTVLTIIFNTGIVERIEKSYYENIG